MLPHYAITFVCVCVIYFFSIRAFQTITISKSIDRNWFWWQCKLKLYRMGVWKSEPYLLLSVCYFRYNWISNVFLFCLFAAWYFVNVHTNHMTVLIHISAVIRCILVRQTEQVPKYKNRSIFVRCLQLTCMHSVNLTSFHLNSLESCLYQVKNVKIFIHIENAIPFNL